MKYVQPFGQPENAPYVNANPSTGQSGSVVPAEALEHTQREILAVIIAAGLTPNAAVLTQLRDAIDAKILAATGGGETSDYLTMTVARARLPIFPEVLTADGRINVTSPGAGSVQIPTAVQFVHRGVFQLSTSDFLEAQRTFATAASKVYHLRWRLAGFVLLDLADGGYNAGALPETDRAFDSTYDDMLIARVVTNAANVATITPLANQITLRSLTSQSVSTTRTTTVGGEFIHVPNPVTLNWARTPDATGAAGGGRGSFVGTGTSAPRLVLDGQLQDGTGTMQAGVSRYAITPLLSEDTDVASTLLTLPSAVSLVAMA